MAGLVLMANTMLILAEWAALTAGLFAACSRLRRSIAARGRIARSDRCYARTHRTENR